MAEKYGGDGVLRIPLGYGYLKICDLKRVFWVDKMYFYAAEIDLLSTLL